MQKKLSIRAIKIDSLFFLCLTTMFVLFFSPHQSSALNEKGSVRDIHLFTVEYQTKMNNNKKDVYRFDPGTIVVHRDEKVSIHLHGFHGKEHVFRIPDFQIKGKVKKGETTIIPFEPDRIGTFKLICDTHATHHANGPMIAYITVIP